VKENGWVKIGGKYKERNYRKLSIKINRNIFGNYEKKR
jgi:hypothetical protein